MPAPLTLAFVRTVVVAARYRHIAKLFWANLVTSNVVPIVVSALAAIDRVCGHRSLPICGSFSQRPNYIIGYGLKEVRLVFSVGNRECEGASCIQHAHQPHSKAPVRCAPTILG